MISFKENTSYRKKGLVTHPRALKQRVIDMLFSNRTNSCHSSFQKFLRIFIFIFLNGLSLDYFSKESVI